MLKTRPFLVVGFLFLALLTAAPSSTFALAGLLTRPGVGISPKSGLNAKKVQKVLANTKYKYVTGSFINQFTSLFYSGTTDDLGDFLDDLAALKGAKVSLKFLESRGVADTTWFGKTGKKAPCQWVVSHQGSNEFGITVFLGDGKIKKEDLDVPPGVTIKTAKKPKQPAKTNKK